MGPAKETAVAKMKGYTLNYNEFIVYDTRQIKMRYLAKIRFDFKQWNVAKFWTFVVYFEVERYIDYFLFLNKIAQLERCFLHIYLKEQGGFSDVSFIGIE